MLAKKFSITYSNTGKIYRVVANSLKERNDILLFMRQRKHKDSYRNIKVKEIN